MKSGSSALAWTRRAAGTSPEKPPWPSATKSWRPRTESGRRRGEEPPHPGAGSGHPAYRIASPPAVGRVSARGVLSSFQSEREISRLALAFEHLLAPRLEFRSWLPFRPRAALRHGVADFKEQLQV